MKILILDDDRERHKAFRVQYAEWERTHVWTAPAAIEALKGQSFDLVTLDHDLADEHYLDLRGGHEGTGRDVSHWMAEHMTERPTVIVHSWNIDAAGNMVLDLEHAGFDVSYQMFGAGWA